MSSHRSILAASVLVLLVAAPLQAQRSAIDSAIAATQSAFGALQARDFDGFAAAMHPEALAQFGTMVGPFLRMAGQQQNESMGDMLQLFGVKTAAELADLPPERLFTGFMRVSMAGLDSVELGAPEIIGGLAEGDSLVHVVYRMGVTAGGQAYSNVSLASLKRWQGRWKLMLSGSLDGMVQPFGAMGSGDPVPEQ